MEQVTARIDEAGRLTIPSHLRKEMGLTAGSEVIVACEAGELRVYTREQALRKLQTFVRGLAPPGVSVVDELIADRRKEAGRELEDSVCP
jgi:AbrB family looped-hinge helix DNA binding protein